MEGHKSQPLVTIQRVFAQTRFSEDSLAQTYEYVLRQLQQIPPNKAGFRSNAACAAALIGCGRPKDAKPLDDKERARWRK
jgi:hypothetical protein